MKRSHSIVGLVLLASIGCPQGVIAQVSADGTVGTIVSPGPLFNITGGTRPSNGPNLFHSFSQFSLPTGSSAIFQNDPAVQTIFSRVTGGSRSDINGTIQTQGNASLFLMNPSGIVFGPNAKLELGGSFVGTTANSIKFSDGVEFSAVNPVSNPLLTVNLPIGLQMGQNPGAIQINNSGHLETVRGRGFVNRGGTASGLSLQTGKTFALIGGNVSLRGGIVNVPNGQVELGAVASPSLVTLNPNSLGWTFDYGNITQFGNIQLGQKSVIEASNTGAIRLIGNHVSLYDGSVLLLENRSTQPALGIEIKATGTVEMVGATPNATSTNGGISSGIISDTRSSGLGGNITITADQIVGRDNGGGLRSFTFSDAKSGNITLNANEIILRGGNIMEVGAAIRTLGKGNGGQLTINTGHLTLQDASLVNNVNNGSGNAGDVIINATESVLMGPNKRWASSISSSAVSAMGNAGEITINTPKLALMGGALISSSTYGEGNAGLITLNVSESLEMSGVGFNSITSAGQPTAIRTSGILLSKPLRASLGLPGQVTGNAGGIIINTPHLQIADSARLSVSHDSVGNAGKIEINANTVRLNTKGQITATTTSGEGGNITFNLRDALLMRNSSVINTESKGVGNGGNITIDSPIIVGLENSDIIANAKGGRGGNINIKTQDLIGLKFRNTLTPRTNLTNDITASSEFNINGNVSINTIGVDPNSGLVSLPVDLTDASRQIADRCSAAKTGSFVSTGRGGIPQKPIQRVKTDRPWNDLRPTVATPSTMIQPMATVPAITQLVEASAIEVDETGAISLVAPQVVHPNSATCSAALVRNMSQDTSLNR
jgi:filamentous hemagglutinin family protein